jgi:hypothetical protein
MLANQVQNWEDILSKKANLKNLKTFMSFNNGGQWDPITAPTLDSNGENYACSNCALNLHSISTTNNAGRVFSTSSAPGIIMGVGSVTEFLALYDDSDTFLSTDAGLTWIAVAKGPHKYEVIDMGATLVMIPDLQTPIDYILFSKDRGKTWERKTFLIDNKKWICLYTTLDPQAISRKILMVAVTESLKGKRFMVNLDFTAIYSRQCVFDKTNPEKSVDFELFTPGYQNSHSCLMGEIRGFYRRNANADCFTSEDFDSLKNEKVTPCTCTRMDYGFVLLTKNVM